MACSAMIMLGDGSANPPKIDLVRIHFRAFDKPASLWLDMWWIPVRRENGN